MNLFSSKLLRTYEGCYFFSIQAFTNALE